MPQPTPYDRQQSFTLLAQVNPADPYTGTELDAEFNAVKETLDEVLANLALIQRSDGFLANQTVGPDQLAASLNIGINQPSMWSGPGHAYSLYDTVFNGTSLYKSLVAHTSTSSFATDLANGKWTLLSDLSAIAIAIADNSIAAVKLQDAAVTSPKLGALSVSTTKIQDLAVTTAKINAAAVTATELATNAVATAKIQDAAVTTAKILDANVTTGKIVDAAVTLAKMASMTAARFIGRIAGGDGAPTLMTGTQATALLDAMVGDSGAGGTKGLVPAPATGDAAARKYLGAAGTFTQPAFAAPDVILEDQKTSGTNGGTFTSGADRTRDLNTEVRDVLGIDTLSGNQFTLPAGTYVIEWSAPAAGVTFHQSMLYDVTGAAVLKRGESQDAVNNNNSMSRGYHVVTVGGSNTFEIRHRCAATIATSGFGLAASFGTELYAWVRIWKTA